MKLIFDDNIDVNWYRLITWYWSMSNQMWDFILICYSYTEFHNQSTMINQLNNTACLWVTIIWRLAFTDAYHKLTYKYKASCLYLLLTKHCLHSQTRKKGKANIQPSWPHTWWITHKSIDWHWLIKPFPDQQLILINVVLFSEESRTSKKIKGLKNQFYTVLYGYSEHS